MRLTFHVVAGLVTNRVWSPWNCASAATRDVFRWRSWKTVTRRSWSGPLRWRRNWRRRTPRGRSWTPTSVRLVAVLPVSFRFLHFGNLPRHCCQLCRGAPAPTDRHAATKRAHIRVSSFFQSATSLRLLEMMLTCQPVGSDYSRTRQRSASKLTTCSQVIDLHNKLSEETRRADKAEFEVRTRSEKMKSLEGDKQVSWLGNHWGKTDGRAKVSIAGLLGFICG